MSTPLQRLFDMSRGGYGPLMIVISFLDIHSMSRLAHLSRTYNECYERLFQLEEEGDDSYRPNGLTHEEMGELLNPKTGASEHVFELVVYSPFVKDVTAPIDIDFNSYTTLEFACYHGYAKSARYLLTKPFNKRYFNFALEYSAHAGCVELCKLLIERPVTTMYVNKALTRSLVCSKWRCAAVIVMDFRTCLNYKSSDHIRRIYGDNKKKVNQMIAEKRKSSSPENTEIKQELRDELLARAEREAAAAVRARKAANRMSVGKRLSTTWANLVKFNRLKRRNREAQAKAEAADSQTPSTPTSPKTPRTPRRGRRRRGSDRFPPIEAQPEPKKEPEEDRRALKRRLEQERVEAQVRAKKAEAERLVRRAHLQEKLRQFQKLAAKEGQDLKMTPLEPDSPTFAPPIELPPPRPRPPPPPPVVAPPPPADDDLSEEEEEGEILPPELRDRLHEVKRLRNRFITSLQILKRRVGQVAEQARKSDPRLDCVMIRTDRDDFYRLTDPLTDIISLEPTSAPEAGPKKSSHKNGLVGKLRGENELLTADNSSLTKQITMKDAIIQQLRRQIRVLEDSD